jgi:hypothetical protein
MKDMRFMVAHIVCYGTNPECETELTVSFGEQRGVWTVEETPFEIDKLIIEATRRQDS